MGWSDRRGPGAPGGRGGEAGRGGVGGPGWEKLIPGRSRVGWREGGSAMIIIIKFEPLQ